MKNTEIQQLLGKLKALEPKYFFIVLGAAAALVIAFDGLLILRPQIMGIMALTHKTGQLKTDIDTLAINKQRMVPFKASLEQAQRQMTKFKLMVHKEDEIPSVLKTVSTFANQYGVKIDQLVPQKSDGKVLVKSEDGNYTSLSIMVVARAGYHDWGRLLNRLEQESVFWQVESMDITSDPQNQGKNVIKTQMKILILSREVDEKDAAQSKKGAKGKK